jgi:ASC-1-like (ASCH) protein
MKTRIKVTCLTMFLAKREVFEWLKNGKKTIDIRRGKPRSQKIALFVCGHLRLKMKIVNIHSGGLREVLHQGNFRQVIPSATNLEDALSYLRTIYNDDSGFYTAYTVEL